ncbi:hypothetical protein KsCSTR_15590 [Candidatus Kuenenia stuttgartiensis]|uniref:Uncharacterized protein n=2 Tax=Kuenenia stuttgartiensis TaxID=174633 RepID=Q1Q1M8_KUEST|nr:hypothetical protein KsCSTR_15590 [Candidatus Kuenenia stuttgartiensis]CAJ73916.1 unknown protein [Candidatus Kuenenia stuttgartiensis]
MLLEMQEEDYICFMCLIMCCYNLKNLLRIYRKAGSLDTKPRNIYIDIGNFYKNTGVSAPAFVIRPYFLKTKLLLNF